MAGSAFIAVGKDIMNKIERKSYNRIYYQANKERIKTQKKIYNKENKEKNNARCKAHREANPEYHKARLKAWYEANPERMKLLKKAWYEANREKVKAYMKIWTKANPEKRKTSYERYKKANPEIAREASRKHKALKRTTQVQAINEKEVYLRDGWICQLCHKRVDKRFKHPNPMCASLDHIVPLSKGGTHTYKNVQLAHLGCNLNKCNNILPQGEQLRLC